MQHSRFFDLFSVFIFQLGLLILFGLVYIQTGSAEIVENEIKWNLYDVFQNAVVVNLSSSFSHDVKLRDNNVITITLNLTLTEYFFGKRMYLKDLFSFESFQTVNLLTSLCGLDQCPHCGGTGIITCSQVHPGNNTEYCHSTMSENPSINSSDQMSHSLTTQSKQSSLLKILSDYSFPCPYCKGFGKIDATRMKMIEFYDSRYFSGPWSSEKEEEILFNETLTTKSCYFYLKQMQTKLQQPYFLSIPSFIFPSLKQKQNPPLSFSLPFTPVEGYYENPTKTIEIVIDDVTETDDLFMENQEENKNVHVDLGRLHQYSFQKNATHYHLKLDVFMTVEEAFHGFQRKIPLFPSSSPTDNNENPFYFSVPSFQCDFFVVNRTNQFTLPNTTVSLPLSMIFHHLCRDQGSSFNEKTEQDNNESSEEDSPPKWKGFEIFPNNYESFYKNHVNNHLLLTFHLIDEEMAFQVLKKKWNCKDEINAQDQRIANLMKLYYIKYQFVSHKGLLEEVYCLNNLNIEDEKDERQIDPVTGEEIIPPREYFANYQYDRLMEVKLRNWLKFLYRN
jgi:hypothetical protein